VIAQIGPLAKGEIPESDEYPKAAELANAARRTRFAGGTAVDVRARALVALAAYASGDGRREKEAGDVISEALVDPDSSIRRWAYAAARRLPSLSGDGVLEVLTGLRDPDPQACVSAFAAVAERTEWEFTRPMWRLFLLATRLAGQSPDGTLRRHAAHALRVRLTTVPKGSLRREAEALLEMFATDIAFSVREAASATE
jgi:hypothetical protein